MIEESALLNSDQIRNLWREKHARVTSCRNARWDCVACGNQLLERHVLRRPVRIVRQTRHFKLPGKSADLGKHFCRIAGRRRAAQHRCSLPVTGIVALCARKNGPIAHHPCVTCIAAHGAQFNWPFLRITQRANGIVPSLATGIPVRS